MRHQDLYAALDLGSNSFRLEIGHLSAGQLRRVEYLKETVRQGAGLDSERMLSQEAMQRGWDCLARFAERLAGFRSGQVRAVATQTLREARNRDVFLQRAQEILGHPIEVISGIEEARLIYLGVAHLLPQSAERRLVVDIGGRSTEMIIGQGLQAQRMDSHRVGSVAWSMKYFPQGQWTAQAFDTAETAARALLDDAMDDFPRQAWDSAYGASGTVGAVADALTANGWDAGVITQAGLDWLRERLIKAGRHENLRLEGIREDRRPVIGGGLSVLRAVFGLLGIERMQVAQGALRHGALFDLLDRESPTADVRSTMVAWLARRMGCDAAQGERVARTAQALLAPLLDDQDEGVRTRLLRKLRWTAQLHEVGRCIAHSDHHKHGAYLVANSDMAGFTVNELARMAQLVLGHRGKLRKMELGLQDPLFVRQLLALRLAVLLCHARRDPDLHGFELTRSPDQRGFDLHTDPAWSQQWPQSAQLLSEEVQAWQKTEWRLRWHRA